MCIDQCCCQDLFKKLETKTKTLTLWSPDQDQDLGSLVSRPRARPWYPGLETKTKTFKKWTRVHSSHETLVSRSQHWSYAAQRYFRPNVTKEVWERVKWSDVSRTLFTCYSVWSAWTDWGPCSGSCEPGVQQRRRSCLTSGCHGADFEERTCQPADQCPGRSAQRCQQGHISTRMSRVYLSRSDTESFYFKFW